jgi:hypothetical protein
MRFGIAPLSRRNFFLDTNGFTKKERRDDHLAPENPYNSVVFLSSS